MIATESKYNEALGVSDSPWVLISDRRWETWNKERRELARMGLNSKIKRYNPTKRPPRHWHYGRTPLEADINYHGEHYDQE